MPKYIIANWKLNPASQREAVALAKAVDDERLIVAPSPTHLASVATTLKRSPLCAQDIFWEETGAFTGQISPTQLADYGARYALIGHSERRALGETDEMTAHKTAAAFRNGIVPVLCIGETAEENEAGERNAVLRRELSAVFNAQSKDSFNLLIAYEPIWAVGTGAASTPENMAEAAAAIVEIMHAYPTVSYALLYGGSVDETNAADFLALKEVGGLLVGGASLAPERMRAIMEVAN